MTFNLSTILAVGIGGFIGAVGRFYVGIQVVKYFPHELPLATLTVNIVGSFFYRFFSCFIFDLYTIRYCKRFFDNWYTRSFDYLFNICY